MSSPTSAAAANMGPSWHEAALRENRQSSFDDLHAVAEDLIRTGVDAQGQDRRFPGRSNGGVLVGAALNQRPDLYSAAIIGSPLVRHEALFAPARRRFLGRRIWRSRQARATGPIMSQIFALPERAHGRPLPGGLLLRLDQGRPGPSRPRAQGGGRLMEYGNRVYFHEYLEGGHRSAPTAEDAKRAALLCAYLSRELIGVLRRHSDRKARAGHRREFVDGHARRFQPSKRWSAIGRRRSASSCPASSPTTAAAAIGSTVGHYTQMIWPTTTRVGCAIASNRRTDYLVCRYSPAGNIDGRAVRVASSRPLVGRAALGRRSSPCRHDACRGGA